MKKIFCIGLAVAVSLSALAADSPNDAKAIQGNWKPATAELAGQPMSNTVLKSISLKLDNGKYEVLAGGPATGALIRLIPHQPKSITVVGTEGPNHGKTFPAIYELKGDTLRICYNLSGAKRAI